MKQNNNINIFSISIKTWISQIFNMSILVVISMLILIFCINFLKLDAIASYGLYVKLFIIALAYIGLLIGTHRSFKTISKYQTYISKSLKYIILLFQLIFFAIFTYICVLTKLDVVFFIGIYLTIFMQFIFNTIYLYLNNRKYKKNNKIKKNNANSNSAINNNNTLIDIDKLQ